MPKSEEEEAIEEIRYIGWNKPKRTGHSWIGQSRQGEIAPLGEKHLEHIKMLKELNRLDHFAQYSRGKADGRVSVQYMANFYEMTFEEAEEHIQWLKEVRGETK